jgi:hypothetical protein
MAHGRQSARQELDVLGWDGSAVDPCNEPVFSSSPAQRFVALAMTARQVFRPNCAMRGCGFTQCEIWGQQGYMASNALVTNQRFWCVCGEVWKRAQLLALRPSPGLHYDWGRWDL